MTLEGTGYGGLRLSTRIHTFHQTIFAARLDRLVFRGRRCARRVGVHSTQIVALRAVSRPSGGTVRDVPANLHARATRDQALSANMSETVTPWEFRVEGEAGSESDERIGAGPRWVGDRGGGEGDAAAVHGGVQAEDRSRGRRL